VGEEVPKERTLSKKHKKDEKLDNEITHQIMGISVQFCDHRTVMFKIQKCQ
jgi:hypothetical protein